MALFDYDDSDFKPSVISAHGLRREVRRNTEGGQGGREAKKQRNKDILKAVTTNIYNYGAGGNSSTADVELRTDKFTNLNYDSQKPDQKYPAKKRAGSFHFCYLSRTGAAHSFLEQEFPKKAGTNVA